MTRLPSLGLGLLLVLAAARGVAQTESEAPEGSGEESAFDEDMEFLDPEDAWADDLPPELRPDTRPTFGPEPTGTFDHGAWTEVLGRHVGEDGLVNYAAWLDDPAALAELDGYLASLAASEPGGLSTRHRVAFWINAYNACAVRLVLDRYPLSSPRAAAEFFETSCPVPGAQSLNDIENVQLGLHSPDPRYHFALCPAARSAPPLRREAYEGEALEEQLAEQTTRFVRDTTRVVPNLMQVELSRLFEWFGRDFERFGGVRTFVAAHLDAQPAETVLAESTMLVYPEFDWRLNEAN